MGIGGVEVVCVRGMGRSARRRLGFWSASGFAQIERGRMTRIRDQSMLVETARLPHRIADF